MYKVNEKKGDDIVKYDFGGWATRVGLKCADGRTIMQDAFKEQDGQTVPLIWQHGHSDATNVLGHALLENRPEGVYAYCTFNDTEQGRNAKQLVEHGDIVALSIYANRLVEKAKSVFHGAIRELSLVLAGSNPGALIDDVVIKHSDYDESDSVEEAIIYTGLILEHSDTETEVEHMDKPASTDETVADIIKTFDEKQMNVFYWALSQALEHSEETGIEITDSEEVISEETETLSHDEDSTTVEESVTEVNNTQEEEVVVHNIFENQDKDAIKTMTLSHSEIEGIFKSAKALGSLKDAVSNYALQHGIENIDVLFPDATAVTGEPTFLKRRTEWVASVLNGTSHTPFSRIRSRYADLTPAEARAKGYIKGNFKTEEFFAVAKRETTPQTIYKKQKLERDDILDITEFDVVQWMKSEMRVMLEEEIARAILMGDGRSNGDDDKINETHIRPIATDAELYQTTIYVNIDDTDSSAEEIIDALTLHRRHYRGSGNPTFYTSQTILSKLLLIKDGMGRRIYTSVDDLKAAIRVRDIVAVEAMEDAGDLLGIMVNLSDYNVGADKGGNVNLFEDFDIDYNAQKYLIETRISGALTIPKAAIVVRKVASSAVLVVPTAPAFAANEVTVPTVTGVTYKNKLTGTTLTTASPVELSADETLTVIAVPASASYYFATSADDEWVFEFKA